MNVYDFDNTIYNGDSTLDFYFYCLKRYPAILLTVPKQLSGFLRYQIGKIDKTEFKSIFFSFLKRIEIYDKDIKQFWDTHQSKIKSWYISNQNKDDIIISASPEFLLEEICKRLNIIHLIASKVDLKTGEFLCPNCYGHEKVDRFLKEYPDMSIENFYSDSVSDLPMARIAGKAYLLDGDKIKEWKMK